jgi:hypothetical protein
MKPGLALLVAFAALGCGPSVPPPARCPEPSEPAPVPAQNGPVPPLLEGHFEVVSLKPKDLPAAPPETYLLPPDERSKCAFVRIVMTFERETLGVRYEALCVEPEDRKKNPIPLKWCSTQGIMHVTWGVEAFELPVPAGTRANVQQIASYAPGTVPAEGVPERTLWGCKFNLDAQKFDIVERTKDRVKLRAPKYDAIWELQSTKSPAVDPDDVVASLESVIHPPGASPPPSPDPAPEPGVPSPGTQPKKVHPGDDGF